MILKKKINMVTLIVICCTISVRFYGKIVLLYGILHWLSTSETEYKGGADACYSSTVYAQKMRQSRGHAILVYCQDTCLLIDHEEVGQRGLNWNGVSKRDVKCYTKHYFSYRKFNRVSAIVFTYSHFIFPKKHFNIKHV